MLFVELRFLAFFAIFFCLYWALRKVHHRNLLIVLGSYLFYGSWDWRFLGLILLSTVIDYVTAIRIERSSDETVRRNWMLFSVISNLSILGFFKYFDFFATSLVDFVGVFGGELDPFTLNIILPVGISFYTLQTMSYTLDVYTKRSKANPDFLNVAAYVAFFPQLVAGPILRAHEFIPQLVKARRWSDVPVQASLLLFLVGFAKKSVIADNIAPYVDYVFADPGSLDYLTLMGGSMLWSFQVYCDFSGYSDMAIGAAGLLGFHMKRNFYMPQLSTNPTEYRRRWHISLTLWLRDYLYIPLGGNSRNKWIMYRNLFITNLVAGFWHGASWTFIAWGAWNGLTVLLHREWHSFMIQKKIKIPFRWFFGFLVTTYTTLVATLFFRSDQIGDAWTMFKILHFVEPSGTERLPWHPLLVIGAVMAMQWSYHKVEMVKRSEQVNPYLFAVLYGGAVTLAFALSTSATRDFVYFQF